MSATRAHEAPRVPGAAIGAGAVVAVLAVVVQEWLIPNSSGWWGLFNNGLDLRVYQAGANAAWQGRPLYQGSVYPPNLWFIYTPFSALLLAPTTWVHSAKLLYALWTACSFIALAAVLRRTIRLAGFRSDRRLTALAALLAITVVDVEPIRSTIWWGQINILLMALVLLDLARPANARSRGFGVGLAAGIKLTPFIFLPYLLVTKQWRAAWTAVAVFAATGAVGFVLFPSDSIAFFTAHGQVGPVSDHANIVFNQAVTGPLARAVHRGLPPQPISIILELVLAAAGLLLARAAHKRGEELLALLLVGLTGCAVSPISWAHHWVWFAPLIVWLGAKAATSGGKSRAAWSAAAAALAAATFIWTQKTTPWANTDLPFAVNTGFCYWLQTDPVLAMISGSWYIIIYLVILAGFWWFLSAKATDPVDEADEEPGLTPPIGAGALPLPSAGGGRATPSPA